MPRMPALDRGDLSSAVIRNAKPHLRALPVHDGHQVSAAEHAARLSDSGGQQTSVPPLQYAHGAVIYADLPLDGQAAQHPPLSALHTSRSFGEESAQMLAVRDALDYIRHPAVGNEYIYAGVSSHLSRLQLRPHPPTTERVHRGTSQPVHFLLG